MTIIKRIMDNWKQWLNRKNPYRFQGNDIPLPPRTRWHDVDEATVMSDVVEGKEQMTGVVLNPIRFMPEDFDPNWTPEPLEVTKFGDPKRTYIHADGTTHTEEFPPPQPEGEPAMHPLLDITRVRELIALAGLKEGSITSIRIDILTNLANAEVVFTVIDRDQYGDPIMVASSTTITGDTVSTHERTFGLAELS